MMENNDVKGGWRMLLVVLLVLLGLSGFVGGVPMLIDPSGASIGLPDGLLEGVPVDSFVLPGLFLIVVMGVSPCVIAYAVQKGIGWGLPAALGQGVVLVLWICFQIWLWGAPIALQHIYLVWGAALVVLSWRLISMENGGG